MRRRRFLRNAILGTTGWELTRTHISHALEDRTRPNFLVILTDDQTYRAIGYANSRVQTPNLNRLAGEGIIFERAYSASPICVASRASLMTGVFPQQHGSVGLNADGFHKSVIEERRYQTLAQVLSASGYLTGFSGKSHLGPPRDYGFLEGEEFQDGSDQQSFDYAASFLKGRSMDRKPFLMWLATRQPHIPLRPNDEWLALYRDTPLVVDPNFRESPPEGSLYNQGLPGERYYRDSAVNSNSMGVRSGPPRSREEILDFMRAYYAAISRLDHQIGGLFNHLKECGLDDSTVIVFLSDNGYHLGNHGLGNKITMHEESVHVPMFIRWDGLPNQGVRCRELASSLDVYPTLMELAGVQAPRWIEGESLVPVFHEPARAIREYAASECVGVGGLPGMGHRMIRTRKWKYILTDSNEEALFDQDTDPYELVNLVSVPENREVIDQLRESLRTWMVRIGDSHTPPPLAKGE